ncbi:MAG: ABC transporter ATP-binding protein [Nitrospinota bacterium]
MDQKLLSVRNLRKYFQTERRLFFKSTENLKAVNDISFDLDHGKTMGLVGESGSGKTTTGRMILRLIEPTSGEVTFDGVDVLRISASKLRELRKKMQIVFQDPYSSLNPRMTVGSILAEPFMIHKIGSKKDRLDRVTELLNKVKLPVDSMKRYPHQFSGGQRQRIGIARAIALNPEFIVCDEPVSALDLSIQAQIVNLFIDLKKSNNISYLFISHDLSIVERTSDQVAVMYLGKIVEIGDLQTIYQNPLHPYTEALLSATLAIDPATNKKRIKLKGEAPSPVNVPDGCPFHPRCFIATKDCARIIPTLEEKDNRQVACIIR